MDVKKVVLRPKCDTSTNGLTGMMGVFHLTTTQLGDAVLRRKVGGYRAQDKRRGLKGELVNKHQIVRKLVAARGICEYCQEYVELIDYKSNSRKQWTLDRIDNRQAHSDANTVIACLDCNLRRRRQNYERFLHGSRLTFKKRES